MRFHFSVRLSAPRVRVLGARGELGGILGAARYFRTYRISSRINLPRSRASRNKPRYYIARIV